MLTQDDINQLKKVLATKDDLKALATKKDLNDLKIKLDARMDFLEEKMENKFAKVDKRFDGLEEKVDNNQGLLETLIEDTDVRLKRAEKTLNLPAIEP